jgi:hypothetical protein
MKNIQNGNFSAYFSKLRAQLTLSQSEKMHVRRTCETTSPHAKINALMTLLVTIGRFSSHLVYVVVILGARIRFFSKKLCNK